MDNLLLYLISQCLAICGIAFDLISKFFNSKKRLLFYATIASIFFILSYVFLLQPLPTITNTIFLIRGFLYLYYDRQAKPYSVYAVTIVLLMVVYVPFLIIFWQSWLDLLMLISVLLVLILFSLKNLVIIRSGLIINSLLWLVYNCSLNAYMNMVCDTITILVLVGTLIKYRRIK